MAAGGKRVALLDEKRARRDVRAEELANHPDRFLIAYDRRRRELFQQPPKRRGMVRFHMLHDDVIERAPVERVRKVFKEPIAYGVVHRVEKHRLFVAHKVRVIGHAARHGVHAFKKGKPSVVRADPENIVCNLPRAEHFFILPYIAPFLHTHFSTEKNACEDFICAL